MKSMVNKKLETPSLKNKVFKEGLSVGGNSEWVEITRWVSGELDGRKISTLEPLIRITFSKGIVELHPRFKNLCKGQRLTNVGFRVDRLRGGK